MYLDAPERILVLKEQGRAFLLNYCSPSRDINIWYEKGVGIQKMGTSLNVEVTGVE